MYTQHHPCWDAKNRYGLPEETKFERSVCIMKMSIRGIKKVVTLLNACGVDGLDAGLRLLKVSTPYEIYNEADNGLEGYFAEQREIKITVANGEVTATDNLGNTCSIPVKEASDGNLLSSIMCRLVSDEDYIAYIAERIQSQTGQQEFEIGTSEEEIANNLKILSSYQHRDANDLFGGSEFDEDCSFCSVENCSSCSNERCSLGSDDDFDYDEECAFGSEDDSDDYSSEDDSYDTDADSFSDDSDDYDFRSDEY